jgi:hypothetical protein
MKNFLLIFVLFNIYTNSYTQTPPTTSGATRCGIGTVTLSASTAAGNLLKWYRANGGTLGAFLDTGLTITSPVLTRTDSLYVTADSTSSGVTYTSSASKAVVTVTTPPTFTLTGDGTVCNNVIHKLSTTSLVHGVYDTIVWHPIDYLYVDSNAITSYVGFASLGDTIMYYQNALDGVDTLIATAISTTGCVNKDTLIVTSLPSLGLSSSPAKHCFNGSSVLTLEPSTSPLGSATTTWKKSTVSSTGPWTSIPAANGLTSTNTGVLSDSTWYRVILSHGSTVCADSPDILVPVSTNIGLVPGSVSINIASQCTDTSGWTYYENPSIPNTYCFAIHKGLSTLNMDSLLITLADDTVTYSALVNSSATTQHQAFFMGRSWNVTAPDFTGNAAIRFFYDPNDTTTVTVARDTAYSIMKSTNPSSLAVKTAQVEWFKTVGVPYDANWRSSVVGNKFPPTHIKLTPTYGILSGVNYAEFSVNSFSGGTAGAGFGAPGPGGGVGLPVTWFSIDAGHTETGNRIDWSTASEKDNDYFLVEVSSDAIAWNVISSKIEPKDTTGNKASPSEYIWTHAGNNGKLYYRVKQVDFNGKYDYSKIVYANKAASDKSSIGGGNTSQVIAIYPNPTNDGKFTVETNSLDLTEIIITNTLGNKMFSTRVSHGEVLNLGNRLPPGIYFTEISGQTIKLVIQ